MFAEFFSPIVDLLTEKEAIQRVMKSSLKISFIFLATALLWMSLKVLFARMELYFINKVSNEGEMKAESQRRAKTLVGLIRTGVRILILTIMTMTILNELGFSVGPILASAGVASLAVGFGAQNLVKDLIAGFFIILENQIRVGDFAEINKVQGFVQEINFRTIILRDNSGTVHTIPNGTIQQVANFTKGWSAYVSSINVSYKTDLDHAFKVMRDVFQSLKKDSHFGLSLLDDDIEIFGLDQFLDSSLAIKFRIRTEPLQQWTIAREFNRRLKIAFESANIEIPYPQVVYNVSGGAPSLQ